MTATIASAARLGVVVGWWANKESWGVPANHCNSCFRGLGVVVGLWDNEPWGSQRGPSEPLCTSSLGSGLGSDSR